MTVYRSVRSAGPSLHRWASRRQRGITPCVTEDCFEVADRDWPGVEPNQPLDADRSTGHVGEVLLHHANARELERPRRGRTDADSAVSDNHGFSGQHALAQAWPTSV